MTTIRPRRLRAPRDPARRPGDPAAPPGSRVLPLFVREGLSEPQPIGSMPGVVQHSLDSLRRVLAEAAAAGIGGVMLFGVPERKDARGSGADDPDGILNAATRAAVAEVGEEFLVQTDLCLDQFTDHGHCGVLDSAAPSTTTRRSSATARWRCRRQRRARRCWGCPG